MDPVLADAMSRRRLARDFLNLGLSVPIPENLSTQAVLRGDLRETVQQAARKYPDAPIKLGHVEGSTLFDPASVAGLEEVVPSLRVVPYSGEGVVKHPTGDNPIAHALMVYDGLGRISEPV